MSGGLDDDHSIDREWVHIVEVRTPDRVGRIVSVAVVVNPWSLNSVMTMTVTGVMWVTDLRVPGWVDGLGGDGDDRGFIRRTSGFLTEWTWTIFVTVIYEGTLTSCPYEPYDGGGNPGLPTGWTTGTEVVLKW